MWKKKLEGNVTQFSSASTPRTPCLLPQTRIQLTGLALGLKLALMVQSATQPRQRGLPVKNPGRLPERSSVQLRFDKA